MNASHSKSLRFTTEGGRVGSVAGAEAAPQDEVLRRRDACYRIELEKSRRRTVGRISFAEPSRS